MALLSDAVMVLYCDVSADPADHDDWHTYEHLHERLSIPGFLRGTRWTRTSGSPHYLMVYEVAGVDMAASPEYLARLNNPTAWTASTMKRLRGMSRGFCRVAASAGYGLGRTAFSMRFAQPGERAREWLAGELQRITSCRGMASAHLFEPAATPPMTKEQSIRGRDAEMTCVLLATAYDGEALGRACGRHLASQALERHGITALDRGTYELAFTATAAEVARAPANRALDAAERGTDGPRSDSAK
jgi:hypothetical protein